MIDYFAGVSTKDANELTCTLEGFVTAEIKTHEVVTFKTRSAVYPRYAGDLDKYDPGDVRDIFEMSVVYDTWNRPFRNNDGESSRGEAHLNAMKKGIQHFYTEPGDYRVTETWGTARHTTRDGKEVTTPTVTWTWWTKPPTINKDGLLLSGSIKPATLTIGIEYFDRKSKQMIKDSTGTRLQISWQVQNITYKKNMRIDSYEAFLRLNEV
jgi:hypothetical protein